MSPWFNLQNYKRKMWKHSGSLCSFIWSKFTFTSSHSHTLTRVRHTLGENAFPCVGRTRVLAAGLQNLFTKSMYKPRLIVRKLGHFLNRIMNSNTRIQLAHQWLPCRQLVSQRSPHSCYEWVCVCVCVCVLDSSGHFRPSYSRLGMCRSRRTLIQ